MPGCAAGRGAALPLRADRVQGDPAAAPGTPGVPPRGAALRRARGHSHDEARTDGLPEPRRTLGQAPGHQDPPQLRGKEHLGMKLPVCHKIPGNRCNENTIAQLSSFDEFVDQVFYVSFSLLIFVIA